MSHYCGVAEARGKMPCMAQCDECYKYEHKEDEMPEEEMELDVICNALTDEENQPHQWSGDAVALKIALYKAMMPIFSRMIEKAMTSKPDAALAARGKREEEG